MPNSKLKQLRKEILTFCVFISKNQNNSNINILKSNMLLMLYSATEAITVEFLSKYYDYLNAQQLKHKDSEKIFDIYLSSKIKDNSNSKTLKKVLKEILSEEFFIKLEISELRLSGNVDFNKVQKILEEHDIDFQEFIASNGKYKNDLEIIKNKRNSLAHGEQSFIEASRDLSIQELKQKTIHILRFLNNFVHFMDGLMK